MTGLIVQVAAGKVVGLWHTVSGDFLSDAFEGEYFILGNVITRLTDGRKAYIEPGGDFLPVILQMESAQ